jgi:predicted DNA-binding transcriptional regulator AlpA
MENLTQKPAHEDQPLADEVPPLRRRKPPAQPEAANPLLESNAVRMHCGNISPMTMWRWEKDLDFPEPDLTVNKRKFWRLSTIDAWIDQRSQRSNRHS